jgi:hypothetical protein
MKGCLAALGILAAVICGVVALAALLIFLSDREPPWHVFSSAISPDNTFVAENSMANSENDLGRISVRRLNGPIVYEAVSREVLPSLFLRWIDNSHLLVLSNSRLPLPSLTDSKKEGSVEVSYSTYVRFEAADASITAKTHSALALEPSNVTATFSERTYSVPTLKQCTLNLSAKDGKKYSEIGMTIMAGVFPCGPPWLRGKFCAEISSHFSVGQKIDHTAYDLLTSATVSEIPSHNELPDGVGYRAIRGEFLQRPGLLIEALKKPSFDIDYNFDFNEQNIRYTVPTQAISAPLGQFLKCVESVVFP